MGFLLLSFLASLMGQLKAASPCQPLPAPGKPSIGLMVLLLQYARSIYTNPRQQDTTHPTAILCAQCRKFHTLAEHFFIHPGLTLTTAWIYDDLCKVYVMIYDNKD